MARRDAVQAYVNKYQEVTGKRPLIRGTKSNQLAALGRRLVEHDISPRLYMDTTFTLWKEWCEERGGQIVPVSILCSDTAFDRFQKANPISQQAYMLERIIGIEVQIVSYAVREILSGREPTEVGLDVEYVLIPTLPSWWIEKRKANSPIYRQAVRMALQHCAFLYSVSSELDDDYAAIAARIKDSQNGND